MPGWHWRAAFCDVGGGGKAWGGAEDAAGVGAVEGAGFGGWVEELWFGEFVDGEVVDGFVGGYRGGV